MGNDEKDRLRISLRACLGDGPLGAGVIVGLLLIVGGTLLFIDNLSILPFDVTDAFWPTVFMVFGAVSLYRTQSVAVRVWSATAIVAGVLLMLGNYRIIHASSDIIWPLVLIATGIVMLIYRMQWPDFTQRMKLGVNIGSNSKSRSAEGKVHEIAVFSAIKRRVETANFEGAELSSLFGSIEVDLREGGASSDGRVVVAQANAVFGGVEIRIPETWRLSLQGHAIFGSYEDKTIPPRPEPGIEIPKLIVRGGAIFGSVIVRN